MSALSKYLPTPPPAPSLVLARSDVFFVRRVALAPGEPVAPQVTLAVEGMAPFPPEQLYYGHIPGADGASALVFAAYRRRFEATDTESWEAAPLVTAEFVPLLAFRPVGAGVTMHVGPDRVVALAWDETGDLPAAVVVKNGGAELVESVLAEARARVGFSTESALQQREGVLSLHANGEGPLEARVGETSLGLLPLGWKSGADIRDPGFLQSRRRAEIRDLWLWRGLLGAAAVLVLAITLEFGAGGFALLTRNREARVAAQKPVVEQIDAAQALANRIGELREKRLMPFEMMAIINPARPDTVIFQRLVTRSLVGLEVEAQAASAEDVGAYAAALKALPALAKVETREVRSRGGVTSFLLALEFKPEALRNGGVL